MKLERANDPIIMMERKGSPKKRKGLRRSFAWYHSAMGDCLCRLRSKILGIDVRRFEE